MVKLCRSREGKNPVSLITDNLDVWTTAIQKRSATGRGSKKKISLHGIKKLRELILELAVRGQLVPQDSNEEPASVLLEKINFEKKQLINDKKIKIQKSLPGITEEEKTYPLPMGWEWVKLGNMVEMYNGRAFKSIEWVSSGIPIVRIQNLNDEFAGFNYFDGELLEQHRISNGSFLISWSGTPGTSFGAFVWKRGEAALNQHINNCIFHYSKTNFDFMRLSVNGCMNHFISMAQGGVGLKHVTKGTLNNAVFGLPPENEQNRIVTKVNELMALCDQLEQQTENSITAHQTLVETLLTTLTNSENAAALQQNWARIETHFDTLFTTEYSIDQLKQTILQLAVMGKLVLQNPKDEPASVLLEKIAVEKAKLIKDKKIKKQKPLAEISEDEKTFELPVGWAWSRIGNASYSTEYGLSEKSFPDIDGAPILAMGQIQSGQVVLDVKKKVPLLVDGLPELYLANRDLLYNRTNSAELVGKTGIYIGEDNKYTFASYLIRIRTDKQSVLPEFINLNMLTPVFRISQILPHLKQQCGQANVNGTIMKNMVIAIAPESEQKCIVSRVDELMMICDQLKKNIFSSQMIKNNLANALVKQAVT